MIIKLIENLKTYKEGSPLNLMKDILLKSGSIFLKFISNIRTRIQTRNKNHQQYEIWLYLNVYAPIHKIIEENIVPSYGYEGLDLISANNIIGIVEKNQDFLDKELIILKDILVEEIYHATICNDEMYYNRFDEDGELCNYIIKEYDRLKKVYFFKRVILLCYKTITIFPN